MNITRILDAVLQAERLHRFQTRKDKFTPFVTHCFEVAKIVSELEGTTETMIIAALYHDVLEDVDISVEMLTQISSKEVSTLVVELTNKFEDPSLGNRKERKLKELERLSKISPEAQTIKLCDRIHNLRSRSINDREHLKKNYIPESRALLDTLILAHPVAQSLLKDEIVRLTKVLEEK